MMNGESLGVEQRLLCTGLFGCRLRWFTHQGFRHLIWPGNTSGSLRRSFWGEGHLEYGWMDGVQMDDGRMDGWMMGGWVDGWMDGWMMGGWVDGGQMDGWMDGC